ncbi:MAG TPA: YceI family protein [Phenylobacterium sp.]
MLRTFLLTVLAALAVGGSAQANPTTKDPAKAPAGAYALDARHASLGMKIAHMGGFSNFAMRFDKLEGGFNYDPAAPTATKVTITVDPTSIHTGLPSFDRELAGPRYFDSARYPAITFVSTRLDITGEGRGQLTGDLTFMGKTHPVTLDVAFNGVGPGMMGAGTRMGFSGTGLIKKSDFGFNAAEQFTGDEVKLDFEVEFVRK